MLWHIALISIRNEVDNVAREEIFRLGQELGERCGGASAGINVWKFQRNLDLRKGVHLVQVSVFRDGESFKAFRQHEAHQRFVEVLREVADWTIGDFSD